MLLTTLRAAAEVAWPVPIVFELSAPGTVTVVIDRPDGTRVRNLINAERFPAGKQVVTWDGLDEGVIRPEGLHYIYGFTRALVPPGEYRARILTHAGLESRYEFTVYPNTGDPPWGSTKSSGGWLADHSAPEAVLFLPAATTPDGKDQMLIASEMAEDGDGLVRVDLDGKKQSGYRWIGGFWTAATHLARDRGTRAPKGIYAYTGSAWSNDTNNTQGEIRIMALTTDPKDAPLKSVSGEVGDYFRQILRAPVTAKNFRGGMPRPALSGLAVHDGIVLAVVRDMAEILVARVADKPSRAKTDTAEILGRIPAGDIRDVAFDAAGRVVALTGDQVLRFALKLEPVPALGAPEVVVASGLESPVRISVGDDGRICVSQAGSSHQVKIFSAVGKLVATVGEPGAPSVGAYHPGHMNEPTGIALDLRGRLWVAERHREPKRISVWAPDGSLAKSFIGPAKYGGGGFIDPRDRSTMYVGQMNALLKFRLDWVKGSSELVAIPYRMQLDSAPFFFAHPMQAPQNVFYAGDRRYLSNCHSASPEQGDKLITLYSEDAQQTLQPLAVVGAASIWPLMQREAFLPLIPKELITRRINPATKKEEITAIRAVVAWSDINGNAAPEPDEMNFLPLDEKDVVRSVGVDEDLVMWVGTKTKLLRIPPASRSATGAPIYNLAAATTSTTQEKGYVITSGLLHSRDGVTLSAGGPITGYRADGSRQWQYHSQWPSLHAGHHSPRRPQYPGQLLATTRPLGWPQDLPDASLGQVWGLNSNYGVMYFFTTDGFFIGTVGDLAPDAPKWRMPRLERHAPMTQVNFSDEHFWPTFTRTSDGGYYMVAGKNHASIVGVTGFETIRRLPDQKITLTPQQVELAARQDLKPGARNDATTKPAAQTLTVPIRSRSRDTRALITDWKDAAWVTLETRNIAFGSFQQGDPFPWTEAAVAIAGDRLHIVVRTFERDLLINSGANPLLLFKTGGALDLQLGTDPQALANRREPVEGDVRLLVARDPKGQPIARLYAPVAPSAVKAGERGESFSSPWRTIKFDRVSDVTPHIQLAQSKSLETLKAPRGTATKSMPREFWEASIPLAALGLKPAAGQPIRADLGVLIGSEGETVQRLYWNNPAGGLVSDVPGEAMLTPSAWGEWMFRKE
ncbi:MAG: hypothetical protein ACKVY0_29170 [Prosthecobacter sp.]|uniref:hypothetical protein n=1 Tax=Prosthecobacter sp. TaxID=1965333 RepID=UPI0039032F22